MLSQIKVWFKMQEGSATIFLQRPNCSSHLPGYDMQYSRALLVSFGVFRNWVIKCCSPIGSALTYLALFLTMSASERPNSRPVKWSFAAVPGRVAMLALLYSSAMIETRCLCTNPRMETATAAAGILQPSPPSTGIAHHFPAIRKNPVEFQVTTYII